MSDEFLAHRKLFGFQADNVRNQMEHLCFLVSNARDRYGNDAYAYLHNRFFSNYRRWCAHINAQRWCFQKRLKHAFDSSAYGARNRMQDLVLYLLIWGEAANMRHCPEYLCFVFYRMSVERQRVIDSGIMDRDHMNDEWFRCHVIQPAYNIAFAMQQYTRNSGSLKDHPKRPNYDDINEYFWNRRWLDHNKTYHDQDATHFWGIKYNRDGRTIEADAKGKVSVQREGPPLDARRKDAARIKLKTFPEKRSWLNLYRSFYRVVEVHLFALHILILFGYGFPQAEDWHQVASCVLTPAGLTVLLELTEVIFMWGVIYAQGLFINMMLRFIVYTAIFLGLFYCYFTGVAAFIWIAIAYLGLRVGWELLNVTTHRWMRKWHLQEDRNFESDVASQLGVWRRIGSTIFWIGLFMLKCFYSYYIYIKPIITLTDILLSIPGWVGQAGIGPNNDSPLSNWLLIVLLWIPTVTMFVIDTQIFFSTTIVLLGILIGVHERVSNVRNWDDVEKGFCYSWRNGARKFFSKAAIDAHENRQLQVTVEQANTSSRGALHLPPCNTPPWHLIHLMWSEMVAEMRAADHISYHDEQLMQFGHFTSYTTSLPPSKIRGAPSEGPPPTRHDSYFLPPFVTAGMLSTFLEMLGELQDRRERSVGGSNMLIREVKKQLTNNETMRIALDEVHTATTLLLHTFMPQGLVHMETDGFNRLLEATVRQKKPFTFLKDAFKALEKATTEAVALAFDLGHTNIIRKKPTAQSLEGWVAAMNAAKRGVGDGRTVEKVNPKAFESAMQALYKFWLLVLDSSNPATIPSSSGEKVVGVAGSAPTPPVHWQVMEQQQHRNEIDDLLRILSHLLSTPTMDARPSGRNVPERLMFFLSSLNSRMPDRQNSIREMYSWTVLTPYVEELVIYTMDEISKPNEEGVTADFYLRSTHQKEWNNFVERMAEQTEQRTRARVLHGLPDDESADDAWRTIQKREWCSFRGQTLLRTVRGMLYYERAIKILAILELAQGPHWTPEQERLARKISQRKFQYVLSCQKFGAFRLARDRRDRGELVDKRNLPDQVRMERRKLLDEAQKADDIDYILRKYPHLRVAYVDSKNINGEQVFASVLIKADVDPDWPDQGFIMGKKNAIARANAQAAATGHGQLKSGSGYHGDNVWSVGGAPPLDPIEQEKLGIYDSHGHDRKPFETWVPPDHRLGIMPGQASGMDGAPIIEVYRVRLPGNVLIGEGKPENQNHAMIFTRGEFLEAIDMNQDNYLEEAYKMRNLLEEFDPLRPPDPSKNAPQRDEIRRPSPVNNGSKGEKAAKNGILKCGILGFRENIFTANLMSVGTYMSLMEATFVSITLRTFAWLGSRMHYGHPDCMDKLFFITRGGMSKSSKMIHVSEDIFAGFKSTLRGGRILHKEWIQCGKGRDLGFNQLFLFEAKLASGAGEQALSREAYRLGHYLDLPRLFSFFYGSIGFYTTTALIVVSIATLIFARMMLALTGVDRNVEQYQEEFGVSTGLLSASSVYQLGLLLILPMLAEIALEKSIMSMLTTYLWMIITGAPFFFFFHTMTKAFFFNNSIMYGGAKYRATGRGFVLSRDSFTRMYRTYARSHIYPGMKLLFMMVVFGIFNTSSSSWIVEMWAPLLLVIAWLWSPMWFNPMSFDHDKVMSDFHEWRRWLDRKSPSEEKSWQGWWITETEYFSRTPVTTKIALTLFNLIIPVLIIAASISALEAQSLSRVYFLLISVGGTVGLVIIGLFLVYQFHPVGDTYRWMKFVMGSIVLALIIVTIIFDTGSTSFGWKGTNFAVYLIVIALTFNCVCKILTIWGAGPYRFGFCLTWFRYSDTIFGLIIYLPWLILSFIGLASVQTRLLYNRAFFKGLKVSELLRGDPEKRVVERYERLQQQERVVGGTLKGPMAPVNTGAGTGGGPSSTGLTARKLSSWGPQRLAPGFTPQGHSRQSSVDDMSYQYEPRRSSFYSGGGGAGGHLMVPDGHVYGYGNGNSKLSNRYTPHSSPTTSRESSRRSSLNEVELAERQPMRLHEQEQQRAPSTQQHLLYYSQSPSTTTTTTTTTTNAAAAPAIPTRRSVTPSLPPQQSHHYHHQAPSGSQSARASMINAASGLSGAASSSSSSQAQSQSQSYSPVVHSARAASRMHNQQMDGR